MRRLALIAPLCLLACQYGPSGPDRTSLEYKLAAIDLGTPDVERADLPYWRHMLDLLHQRCPSRRRAELAEYLVTAHEIIAESGYRASLRDVAGAILSRVPHGAEGIGGESCVRIFGRALDEHIAEREAEHRVRRKIDLERRRRSTVDLR